MKKFWKIVPMALVALLCFSCEKSSSSSASSTTTNTGDDSSDFVDQQTWSSTIDIVWDGSSATVTGSADGVTITNENGYVTVNSTVKEIEYALSGNGSGQFTVYSTYKHKVSLNGLTLTCSDGPAINNQCHKTCYIVIGSTNTLTDGSSYASSDEDRKAALFSEGQLCFSGTGTLNVTGNYKHAVASDDYIRVCEGTGTMNLTAKASDGMHSNDGIIINGGDITINAVQEGIQCDTSSIVVTAGELSITSTSDKGMLAYGNIEISGGTIDISSKYKCIKTQGNLVISGGTITAVATATSSSSGTPEGIEAKGTITISGGTTYAQAYDDAINSGGNMTITGGYVMAYSTGNDGLDANGDCYIKGGIVYAIGAGSPEVGIDANTEGGHQLYVQGGALIAIAGIENGASVSINCYSATASANTWYALYNGGDMDLAFKTPSKLNSTAMVVATQNETKLLSGVEATGTDILNGYGNTAASGGSSVTLSSYSGGNSGMGGGSGPGSGGGGPGGGW